MAKTTLELMQERQAVWVKQKEVAQKSVDEDRELNDDEQRQWDSFEEDFSKLTKQIGVQKVIDERDIEDTLANGENLNNEEDKRQKKVISDDPQEAEEQRKGAFSSFIKYGVDAMTPEEKEILAPYSPSHRNNRGFWSDELEKRAQTVGTDSQGGFLVPEGFSGEIAKARAMYGGMRQAARILKTKSGQRIPWPTVNDVSNVASLLAESGDASSGATDITFSEKVLEAYKLSSDLIQYSRELFEDDEIGIESILNELLGERIGRKENALFTTGTGSSQPNGVVTAGTSGATGATGEVTTTSRTSLLGLYHSVDPAYRMGPKVFWMLNDAAVKAIKLLNVGSSDARPLWSAGLVEGAPATIEGSPYIINQDVANLAASSKSILFGDFNNYVIRDVGGILFRRLVERYAEKDEFGVVAFARVDGELINPGNNPIKFLTQAAS